ncbi:MAG: galactose-1-phosphate uridylyltransferase, partial [Solirubrobacteraceae bacterium]
MSEIRVDPLTGLKTIIASERAGRPGGGFDIEPPPAIDPERDPFAPGHEDQTPPEVYAVRPDGGGVGGPNSPGWTVRVVPNLYPALAPDAPAPEPHANADLFTAQPAAGHHEVIVNAPDPVVSLSDLTAEQVHVAMEA